MNKKIKRSSKSFNKLNKNNLFKGGKPSKSKKKRSSKNNKRSRRVARRNKKILKGGTSPRAEGWEYIHSGLDLPSEKPGEAFVYVDVDHQGRERRVEDGQLHTKVESEESLSKRLKHLAGDLYERGLVSVRGGPLAEGKRRQTQSELEIIDKISSLHIDIKEEDFSHYNKALEDWLDKQKWYFYIAKKHLENKHIRSKLINESITHLNSVIERYNDFIRIHSLDIDAPNLIKTARELINKLLLKLQLRIKGHQAG